MMSDASTKGGNFSNVITHNVIWANQKSEYFMYRWLHAHAMFNVMCFPRIGWSIRRHFMHSVNTLIQ